ncbi:hypothetical protein KIF59_14195 [Enterobacter cloacae subsp. cloacae]|nr:hypothetical protein [Enterobacter cloacae subsp. cloacae]
MWIGIISLFPEMFRAIPITVTGRAVKNGPLASRAGVLVTSRMTGTAGRSLQRAADRGC